MWAVLAIGFLIRKITLKQIEVNFLQSNPNKLLLIDGMALLFRSFYATAVSGQFMVNNKGIPTNAVNGYLKHLLIAISHFNPSHVAVCWDMGSTTFRNEMFDDYKANRSSAPEELIPQFDIAKEVTDAFHIPNVGVEGYEADDCIGTISKTYHHDAQVYILTGDHDILQLLDENIYVSIMKKGFGNYEFYTHQKFLEEKGFHPKQFIDVKGLMGDSSDNYPGVRGIGPKTAEKLIKEFGSVHQLLDSLHLLTPSQRKKIEEDREILLLSRQLAEIKCDVPIQFNFEESKLSIDVDEVRNRLHQLDIKGKTSIIHSVEQIHMKITAV